MNLKEIRLNLGMSQKEVAQKLNIHERQYQKYESGAQVPSATVMQKLVTLYQVPFEYLISENYHSDFFNIYHKLYEIESHSNHLPNDIEEIKSLLHQLESEIDNL